jgi:hypothetical protein
VYTDLRITHLPFLNFEIAGAWTSVVFPQLNAS